MNKTPELKIQPGLPYVVMVKDHFHVTDKKRHGWHVLYKDVEHALWVADWENPEIAAFEKRMCAITGHQDGKWIKLKFHEVYAEKPTPLPEKSNVVETKPDSPEPDPELTEREKRVNQMVEAYIDLMLVENELMARVADNEDEKARVATWFDPKARQKIVVTWIIQQNGK